MRDDGSARFLSEFGCSTSVVNVGMSDHDCPDVFE